MIKEMKRNAYFWEMCEMAHELCGEIARNKFTGNLEYSVEEIVAMDTGRQMEEDREAWDKYRDCVWDG